MNNNKKKFSNEMIKTILEYQEMKGGQSLGYKTLIEMENRGLA